MWCAEQWLVETGARPPFTRFLLLFVGFWKQKNHLTVYRQGVFDFLNVVWLRHKAVGSGNMVNITLHLDADGRFQILTHVKN
jgi:hypothetical protein